MAKYKVEKHCSDGSIEVEWVRMNSKDLSQYRKDEALEVGEFIAFWRFQVHRWKDVRRARMVGAHVRIGYEVVIREGAKEPHLAVAPLVKSR